MGSVQDKLLADWRTISWLEEGIPQGLKPLLAKSVESPKAKALGYLEEKEALVLALNFGSSEVKKSWVFGGKEALCLREVKSRQVSPAR
jgi:hypothetical protein